MAFKDIQRELYNGAVKLTYRNRSHKYYVNNELKQGVTTVLGSVLAKPGLMTWPLDLAIKYLQERLPVVTQEDLDEARKQHTKRRDSGANTGSIVHELAEKILNGENPSLDGYDFEVKLAIGSFQEWFSASKPEVIAVEQIIYSRNHDYAGTFDSILRLNGKNYLCDLKTTNASREAPKGVYNEYFVQLGAYLEAYEEQRQYEEENGGTKLVKIDDVMIISCKKNGVVDTVTGTEVGVTVDKCRSMWVDILKLYRQLKEIANNLK